MQLFNKKEETMKTYNITEEQIKDIALGGGKKNIKEMFPEVFKDKITTGKWYYLNNTTAKGILIFIEEILDEGLKGYGFGSSGSFHIPDNIWLTGWSHEELDLIPATREQVVESLEKEAKKRYGEDWKNAKIKANADEQTYIHLGINESNFSCVAIVSGGHTKLYSTNGVIFHNGNWAEVLEEEKVIEKPILSFDFGFMILEYKPNKRKYIKWKKY